MGNISKLATLQETYLSHDVTMSVAGGQVQRRVIAPVHDVDAGPPHDEHVHHAGAALPARPVQRAEAVVVPTEERSAQMMGDLWDAPWWELLLLLAHRPSEDDG